MQFLLVICNSSGGGAGLLLLVLLFFVKVVGNVMLNSTRHWQNNKLFVLAVC